MCPDFISIHAPREGSDLDSIAVNVFSFYISIHAPREGSDDLAGKPFAYDELISIHAPREGSDQPKTAKNASVKIFQSTLPARGATWQ